MKTFNIKPVSSELANELRKKIDRKTKPVGALGRLEEIALQTGLIQQSLTPALSKPAILVFAADHGIANEGVSAYPQEVTWQMVYNFLQGGAAINVFCRQHDIKLNVVDAGVNYDFPENTPGLIRHKIGKSTASFLREPAMPAEQALHCIDTGRLVVSNFKKEGCNIIGFGEMGIGNTSSASVLMSLLCDIPLKDCVGRGTGLDSEGVNHKFEILTDAVARNGKPDTVIEILSTYGGYEIAQMVGGILQAAEHRMIVLIDGFIATVASLVARTMEPAVTDYCIYCHQSAEYAHAALLHFLHARPVLHLDMRLGEGTGAAIAFPIIKSAVNFLNEMASFESAGISDKK